MHETPMQRRDWLGNKILMPLNVKHGIICKTFKYLVTNWKEGNKSRIG